MARAWSHWGPLPAGAECVSPGQGGWGVHPLILAPARTEARGSPILLARPSDGEIQGLDVGICESIQGLSPEVE